MAQSKKYEAYVDGTHKNGQTGFGAVILQNGKICEKLSGEIPADSSHQVAGEIEAVLRVLEYCKNNNIPEITIHYDYTGLENWARGHWKRKQPLTKNFYEKVQQSGIEIHWNKVKSHSGNMGNNLADALAKKALGQASPKAKEKKLEKNAQKSLETILQNLPKILNPIGLDWDKEKTRIVNNNCLKIALMQNGQKIGYLNIYALKKGGFSIKTHELLKKVNLNWDKVIEKVI